MMQLNEVKINLLKPVLRVTTTLLEQEQKIAALVTLYGDDCNKNGK